MNKHFFKIALLLVAMAFSAYASSQTIWATAENITSVKSTEEFQSFDLEYQISIDKPLSNSRQPHLQQVYEFSCECDVVDLYVAMNKVPGLSGIEYGPVYETLAEPNDYHTYTYYNNPNLTSDWHLDLIWAQAAWDVTHGTEKLAISDQNIWMNHEDIENKLLYYDTTNTHSQGHGTAVSTLAAGDTDNGVGIASIGYDTQFGFFRMNYNEVLSAAYSGYKVVNMSWTSGCNFNTYVNDALHEVYGLGVFLVASAGNGTTCGSPTELVYPASYDVVFSVSSVGADDSHEQANGNTHQHNSSVDLTAPGYDVPITAAPGWYLFGSGTSYAAPIVAGTASLIQSVFPGISPAQIKYILQSTAVNIDAQNPNYIGMLGSGRLMAGEAVKTALSLYLSSQNSGGLTNPDKETIDFDFEVMDDGNNGHGNDEGGVDPSNPGQGNGNNGNNGNGNRPDNGGLTTITDKSMSLSNGIYDMSGKKVNLEYATSGIYLVVENGIVIRKIWK